MDYIEHNTRVAYHWLVVDIDHENALERIEESRLPEPNMVIINPKNGHAHAFWLLEKEVPRFGKARWKPIYYFKAVWRGFTRRLGGDLNYVQLITKNPYSTRWKTIYNHNSAFSLNELDDYLEHSEKEKTGRQTTLEDGAGRNVCLFNTLRIEAYSRYAQYLNGKATFYDWIYARAEEINATFPAPLDQKEVDQTIKSISGYCEQKIREDYKSESFSDKQRRRVNVRWEKWRRERMKFVKAGPLHTGRVYILIGIKKVKETVAEIVQPTPLEIPVGGYGSVKELLRFWPPE